MNANPQGLPNDTPPSRFLMSRRIAIVEDEAELAGLIEYNLARAGFQPRIFGGEDGTLAGLELFQPDLIVLDVMLPGHDGFELCRRIRAGGKTGARACGLSSPRARMRSIACSASKSAATITSPSRSARANWSRASRPICGARKRKPRRIRLRSLSGRFRLDQAARRVYQNDKEVELDIHRIQAARVLHHAPWPRLFARTVAASGVGRAAFCHARVRSTCMSAGCASKLKQKPRNRCF